ncbi:MAG: hypothetical protein F6K21_14985 [Symploca sp. SIO2D2]|nr:hypothetical protein [Symploca sp. SIO2D2]
MEFSYETFSEAWTNSLRLILSSGEWVQSERGQKTIELRNVSLIALKPFSEPRIPDKYQFDNDYIEVYCNSFFENNSVNSISHRLIKYGVKYVNQLESVIGKLKTNQNTRRAVISLWEPSEDISSQHPPCPIVIQFIIRFDKLEMSVILRSSDAWMAAIPDYIALTRIQKNVAKELGVNIGKYTQYSISYHIYEFDVMLARDSFL